MIALVTTELEVLAYKGAETLDSRELYDLLFEKDYKVRSIAAKVLQIRGEKALFDEILQLSHHEKAYVREISAFILGQYGTPEKPYREQSIRTIISLLNDENFEVRASAAAAIGHLYDKDMPEYVEEALFEASSDRSANVRLCVASSLGSSKNIKSAKEILEKLLKDKSQDVVEWAELGLEILLGDFE